MLYLQGDVVICGNNTQFRAKSSNSEHNVPRLTFSSPSFSSFLTGLCPRDLQEVQHKESGPASLGSASTSHSEILSSFSLALPSLLPFHLPRGRQKPAQSQPEPTQAKSRAVAPTHPSNVPSSIPSLVPDHPKLQHWTWLERLLLGATGNKECRDQRCRSGR